MSLSKVLKSSENALLESFHERSANCCFDSPIEEMLAYAFFLHGATNPSGRQRHYFSDEIYDGPDWWREDICNNHGDSTFVLEPQVEVGKYRADFRIDALDTLKLRNGYTDFSEFKTWSVFVECDGREFHHGNEVCAARDKKRDRQITLETGFTVLRFTGTEIHKDAFGCVGQAIETLESQISRDVIAARKAGLL